MELCEYFCPLSVILNNNKKQEKKKKRRKTRRKKGEKNTLHKDDNTSMMFTCKTRKNRENKERPKHLDARKQFCLSPSSVL